MKLRFNEQIEPNKTGRKISKSHTGVSKGKRTSLRTPSPREEEQTLWFQKQQLLWVAESGRETSSSTGSMASKAFQLPWLPAPHCCPPARGQTWGDPDPQHRGLRLGMGSRAGSGNLPPSPSAEALIRVFLLYPAVHFYETCRNLISLRLLLLFSNLSESR